MLSSTDIEYKHHIPNSLEGIELLIEYRYKYDTYYMMGESTSLLEVDGVAPLREEMILTYVVLDELIRKCKFSKDQLRIIEMSEMGYTQEEIANELNVFVSTIRGRLDTIYKAILEQNLRDWRKSFYINHLKLKTKTCSKCKEVLPATPEFYGDYYRNRDKLQSQCRKCKK